MNTESTARASTSSADPLALLPLPRLDALTEQQVRGSACIWDAIPLTPTIAVDLGARATRRAGQPVTWYPRACRRCASLAALRALHDHAPGCLVGCEPAECSVCRTLLRLIRDAGREHDLTRSGTVVLPCQPCALGAIFGPAHRWHDCTGTAAMPSGRRCPCVSCSRRGR